MKITNREKEKLEGVLRALSTDTSRADLLYATVRDGWIYATDGMRMHFAEMDGLPENGVYHVAFMPLSEVAFVSVEQKPPHLLLRAIGAIRPCNTALSDGTAGQATLFALKSGIPFRERFFVDAQRKEGREIAMHWYPRIEGKAAEAVLFDNGLWYSLVMPVRDDYWRADA